MRARPWIACCFLVFACSSSSEPTPAVDPVTPPPPPAEPPPPIECDGNSYLTAANTCERFPTLSVTRSPVAISPIRDHHSTTVIETAAGPYLYVFGGTDEWRVIHNDAQRARIHEDGTLDPFEPAGTLPAPRAGHCFARIKDRFFLAGGVIPTAGSEGPSSTSVLFRIDNAGNIVDAVPGPTLPKPVMHGTCETHGDYVYAIGGRGKTGSTTLSARARIGADGSLGAFQSQTALSPDRSHHASFVRENRLYVLGGLTGDPTGSFDDRSDAIVAAISEDGALGAWSPAGSFPTTLSVSSAQLYKDAVYVFGGLDNGTFTDKIRRATFLPDGTLSAFEVLQTRLPAARGHVHQTPMWKTLIFSVGGKEDSEASLGTVDVGVFR